MSALFLPTAGPGVGLFPSSLDCIATSRNQAVVVGELVQFDLLTSDTLTSNLNPGDAGSAFANVVPVTASSVLGIQPTIFAVALTAAAENAEANFRYFGEVKALIEDDTDSVAIGDVLAADAGGNLLAGAAVNSGDIIIAIAAGALTTPTTPALANVFLFGTLLGTFANLAFDDGV